MSTEPELEHLSRALKTNSRRRLTKTILVSATLTVLVSIWLLLEVRSQKQVEANQAALSQKAQFAEEVANQAKPIIEEKTSANPIPPELTAAVQAVGKPILIVRRTDIQGYFVVLGSYKQLSAAITKLHELRRQTDKTVRLFWAVNGYYAPVIGILNTKDDALQTQLELRSTVPDAYLFSSWAFPYEVVEQAN